MSLSYKHIYILLLKHCNNTSLIQFFTIPCSIKIEFFTTKYFYIIEYEKLIK